ncbi:ANL family adenylate-forming protein [Paenibacillus kobensis]|uniref:ANL family adenylate-forming protein n=1 Tax=Paenibacillus kobensis TaxID=59841 RepID=UPI000FDB6BAA|nr:fatty acid--CoA ligase family protein [Paenibacillus kobensis]
MDKLFLSENGREYSYGELISDLNRIEDGKYFVYYNDHSVYSILIHMIHCFIHGYSVEILDSDLSETELQHMGIDPALLWKRVELRNRRKIRNINEGIESIIANGNSHITLYTSGTTGRPKKVRHSLSALLRNVRISDKHSNDIWVFAYNPTHIAGILVLLQAVMNQNSIVYTFGEPHKQLEYALKRYEITHISASPTYYRNAITSLNGSYPHVVSTAFGGEKYDKQLEQLLKGIFPNARILNIYASTETGSLFTGSGEWFELNPSMRSLVKISAKGEVLIHYSILGTLENVPDTTQSEWYATGDIVDLGADNKFRFVSRISGLINVGGYKANPEEIEGVLLNVPGVIDVAVKGQASSVTGNIIVADVMKKPGLDEVVLRRCIKEYAKEQLQHWKVPLIIHFVEQLPHSRSGKKRRDS